MNEKRVSIGILALFALLLSIDLMSFGALRTLDNWLGDHLLRTASRNYAPDPDIVMLVADERSLAILGEEVDRWPWPREVFGDVTRAIAAQRPAAIVFDITFADPDLARPASDAKLSQALRGLPNVYFPMVRNDAEGDSAAGISLRALAPYVGLAPDTAPDARADILLPRALDRDVWRLGAINFLSDEEDGRGRRAWLRLMTHGWPLPSMSARVARDLGWPIPDQDAMVLAWPAAVHTTLSFVDVYDDVRRAARGEATERPANEFTGKIVIVGANATGLLDRHPTPRSTTDFGPDIVATALDNLKHERYLHMAPAYVTAAAGLVLLVVVWLTFAAGWNSLNVGLLLTVLTVGTYHAASLALGHRWVVYIATPIVYAWVLYITMALKTYLGERDLRLRTTEMFSRFVNPHVVRQLLAEGGFSREATARDVTVMFCDIRGFTTLCQGRKPQDIVALLNKHFARQVDVIFRHGGTLDKFIGDAMMAIWGAPVEDEKHAEHAVACALDMIDAMLRFRETLPPELAEFDIGIGIHSGEAVVGLIGPERRPEYTAIGDTVNVASRIEGLTSALVREWHEARAKDATQASGHPPRILVSDATRARAGDAFEFVPVGERKLKGRDTEVQVFEPRRKPNAS